MLGVTLVMELLEHTPSDATQQLQGDLESTTDDDRTASRESSDLQGDGIKDGLLSRDEKEEWRCSPSSWDWKKLLLITSLWWSHFLINGAHSVIGPFFPNQVMHVQ